MPEHKNTDSLRGILVREYRETDELNWVSCRLRSFLDSSYRDDVQQYREKYHNPSVRAVAIHQETGELVGLLDVEYETHSGQVCHFRSERGGVLWHLGVLPTYRRRGIACALWGYTRAKLLDQGISRIETWTQDDEPANSWYRKHGFTQKGAHLNVYVRGVMGEYPLNQLFSATDWQYGHVRSINFEAELSRRAELEKISYRLHEVRVYETRLIDSTG